jgi:hypothetical protein
MLAGIVRQTAFGSVKGVNRGVFSGSSIGVSFLKGENGMSDHRRDDVEGSASWLKAEERKTLAHAYAVLFKAGYRRFEPGCRLVYHNGLLFVYYEDPSCDRQTRLAMLKSYQEALSKRGIKTELCDDPTYDFYLCG